MRVLQPGGAQRPIWTAALALLLVLVATAGLAASAQAANYTVGTTADVAGGCAPESNTCSLRQLIEYEDARPPLTETETPDVIVVPAGGYNLTLGELKITQTLVILGAGARTTTVAESVAAQRVFEVAPPETGEKTPTVVISGLTISGGSSGYYGGDIYNKALLLLVEDWITGGQAISGGGISNDAEAGGVFHEAGTLVLRDSLVSGNHANAEPASGGGIQNHGARGEPGAKAILVVEDSTVADNDASLASGIYSFSPSGVDENQVSIINSTIAHNVTQDENGIPAAGLGAGLLIADGAANVFNSILAFNSEEAIPNNCATAGSGTITTPPGIGGYNIETGTDCNFTSVGDRQNTNPDFSSEAPQNNGGNTDTLGLNAGSPAIDAIPAESLFCTGQADQRGLARPQGAGCDIGAFEYGNVAIITPPPPPPPPAAPPTVLNTAPPSVLSTTSATFTATVNPNGLPTTVHFEYGGVFGGATVAAITYNHSTPNQTLPADFTNHTVTATVTGLLPNVTYHVRAVATNGAGNVLGPDQILQ
ncbi:MAG TPA: choice-of-anchor Q domain-containing protein, partial [Solirubrobacteraceae bacterium]